MIGEIGNRYRLFLRMTCHIKTVPLVQAVRTEFQNYFGEDTAYLLERKRYHKLRHNGKSYYNQELQCKYFILKGYKAVCINFTQQTNAPKHRGFSVKLTEWDNESEYRDMVPFIKFSCNPIGIHLLEKISFRGI